MQEQNKVFEIINPNSASGLILTCEHASSQIPESYNNLGLSADKLDTHIARDKGCKELTEVLAQKLGCTAFIAGYSRLFIDYNRRENEDSLILDESDKVLILGNLKVDANVPYDMRQYNTGAAAICGEDIGLENAVIEIKDTEFNDMQAGVTKWSDLLINILV